MSHELRTPMHAIAGYIDIMEVGLHGPLTPEQRADFAGFIHAADTGIGIPSAMLEAIFDPFVQVKPATPDRHTGAGLGLAVSRGLARGMHGDLRAGSTQGTGARFTLALPLAG